MRVVWRTMGLLCIGAAVVALAIGLLAWQLPSLQGTITIGDGDVTLRGFDDPDGDNAGLAMVLAGVAVIGACIAAAVATVVAVVVGLGAAALGLGIALVAVAGSLLLVASPLLLIGALVWLVVRRPRPRPDAPAAQPAIAAS